MELLTVPQEHRVNLEALSGSAVRAYILEHGFTPDGRHYEKHSGSLRSTLSKFQVSMRYDDEITRITHKNWYVIPAVPDRNLPLDKLLTVREFNVVISLTMENNKAIAAHVGTTENMVKNMLREASAKTQLPSRYHLIQRYAREWKAGLYPDLPCPVDLSVEFVDREVTSPHSRIHGLSKGDAGDRAVMQHIVEPNEVISNSIGMAPRTVKAHVVSLLKRLRLSNRTELVAYAELKGLL